MRWSISTQDVLGLAQYFAGLTFPTGFWRSAVQASVIHLRLCVVRTLIGRRFRASGHAKDVMAKIDTSLRDVPAVQKISSCATWTLTS